MEYVTFPFEKFVSCITTEYDVQADSILALYIDIAKYLRDNPIVSGLTVKEIIERYLEENPPTVGVVSVNGKTGVVTGLYDADNPPPYPVTSVNGKTGAVTGLYDAQNPPPYPVTSVNGKTGDVIIQEGGGASGVTSVNGKTGVVTGLYDADNPPPYPVTSVNGKTGAVAGLYSDENAPPYPVNSVFGLTGAISAGTSAGITETEPGELSIDFPPLSIISMGSDSATLPAGNAINRYIIVEAPLGSGDWQYFIPVPRKQGVAISIGYSGSTSDGHGLIRIQAENVGANSQPLSYAFSVINMADKNHTIIGFTRYEP